MQTHPVRQRALPLLMALVAFTFAACDFSAVRNPADDFELIIGLQPINTVVTAQVIDAVTGQPVRQAVTLTFAGEHGGKVIDIYSDPLPTLQMNGGVTTFGLANDVVPTPEQPARLSVTAKAEGYLAQRQQLVLTQEGSGSFVVRLLTNNPHQNPAGATGTRSTATNAGQSGAVSQTVTVSTAPAAASTASATVTIPQGTVARTAAGTPLVGQITTDLRAFGTNYDALAALPDGAKKGPNGAGIVLAGALYVKVSDEQGHVATTFEAGAGRPAGKRGALTCAAGVAVRVDLTAASAALVATGDVLKVYAYSVAAQTTTEVGRALIEDEAGAKKAAFCLGASAAQAAYYVDVTGVDVSQGVFYAVVPPSTSCPVSGDARITIRNPNATALTGVELRLLGPATAVTMAGSVDFAPNESKTYRLADYLGASIEKPVAGEVGFHVLALTGGDGVNNAAIEVEPCVAGTTTLDLSPQTSTIQANVTAVLDCGVGKKIEPQVDPNTKLDGLSVGYRQENASTFTIIPKSQFSYVVSKQKVEVYTTSPINVVAGRQYVFSAVMGTGSASTAPVAAGANMAIVVSPADVGLSCINQ